jgi:modulator of FtsH protease
MHDEEFRFTPPNTLAMMTMAEAYRPDAWQALFGAVAAASAALTGLLFVALSINLKRIIGTPEHLGRAREVLGQLLSLLLLSIILLIPGQNRLVLGTELVLFGAILAGVSVFLHRQTLKGIRPGRRVRWGARVAVWHVGTLAIPIAGASLLLGHYGGLFWLVFTVLIYFLWSSINAWTLVVASIRG